MNIYVFKTSISTEDVRLVNSILRSIDSCISWNYDLEDRDNILRIESTTDITETVRFHLTVEGFYCEELA